MNEEILKSLSGQFGTLATTIGSLVASIHGVGQALHGLEQVITAPVKAFASLAGVMTTYREAMQKLASGSNTVTKSLKDIRFDALAGTVGAVASMFGSLVAGLGNVIGGLLQLGIAALPGGLETFQEVIGYVTAVIGSALAPAIVLVLSGLLTLADMLRGPIMAGVEAFLSQGIDHWIQVVGQWVNDFVGWSNRFLGSAEGFLQGLQVLVTVLTGVVKFFQAYGPAVLGAMIGSIFGPLGAAMGALAGLIFSIVNRFTGGPDRSKGEVSDKQHQRNIETRARAEGRPLEEIIAEDEAAKRKNRGGVQIPKIPALPDISGLIPKDTTKNALDKNIGRIIDTMQFHQSKQNSNVGFSGIADVQRQIQMQAIQSDIEAERQKTQNQMLDIMREWYANYRAKRDNPPMLTRK